MTTPVGTATAQPPVVTAVTPAQGRVAGGTSLTVTCPVTAVLLNLGYTATYADSPGTRSHHGPTPA